MADVNPKHPELIPIDDDRSLPRVLLIGDSISMGYTLPTRERLRGKANIHRIPENGGPTTNGLQGIPGSFGAGHWDVIHFNWGLHDLKIMEHGEHQVLIKDYERNLRELVGRLEATGARLIWATTTPVPEGSQSSKPKRFPEDAPRYNAVARKVMNEHGVAINDLFAVSMARCEGLRTAPGNVHYTDEGYRILAQHVAASIEQALSAKPS
jgi:acyl-CoA thioesterase-1